MLGSAATFSHDGRRPWSSVNFITAHDGFTLIDLVSYNDKHNEANGEDNRDGHSHNLSWNCGAEGPTDDPEIIALRERQRRNLMATLLLSQGTPMILMGDERGRTPGWQQQRLLPARRDELARLGRPAHATRRSRNSSAGSSRSARRAACSSPSATCMPAPIRAATALPVGFAPTARRWSPASGTTPRRAVSAC